MRGVDRAKRVGAARAEQPPIVELDLARAVIGALASGWVRAEWVGMEGVTVRLEP